MSYLETTHNVYKEAALTPDIGLCCTTNPIWELPGLKIPRIMQEMNYGCGSTVHARDLTNNPKMLYVGVGGGMELLQFAYFNRNKGGVIGLDVVDEMLEASRKNFKIAEEQNDWFKSDFVDLRKGDAMDLPVEDNPLTITQNGAPAYVIESAKEYEKRQETIALLKLLALSAQDKQQGRVSSDDEFMTHIQRRKSALKS